ncbi:hypothetical protein HOD61_02995 [archaeon]|jgi:GMP synthase-like glutamine amidotransferase|nr:hypothetical protein [archaeon]
MILIISTCSERLNEFEFVQPVAKIVGKGSKIIHYSKLKKKDILAAEKVIICGTALNDNEYLNGLDKFEWITEFSKPLLGICSGMQILGLKFGAKLVSKEEIGTISVEVKVINKLFSKDFEAYGLHGNSLSKLGEFDVLAKSKKSVQAIKRENMYGIMFHPEVRNEDIVRKFISTC